MYLFIIIVAITLNKYFKYSVDIIIIIVIIIMIHFEYCKLKISRFIEQIHMQVFCTLSQFFLLRTNICNRIYFSWLGIKMDFSAENAQPSRSHEHLFMCI